MLPDDLVVADVQAAELPGFRVPPGRWVQPLQAYVAYPGARQPQDLVSNGLEHPAHLAFLAFVDDEDHLGVVAIGDGFEDFRGRCLVLLDLDSRRQLFECLPGGLAVDEGHVFFLDLEAGVGDAVVQLAHVGQQQQPLGFPVKPADG